MLDLSGILSTTIHCGLIVTAAMGAASCFLLIDILLIDILLINILLINILLIDTEQVSSR